ncbi:hypothetical protein J5N97_025682 [Dioscorea zingiberensis]|uniref:DUF4408 domain-containing protein n=1 Tax=Dioscorea zingiberensis TaxID=325984 RepID=A0A9D5C194_9LILI|nr:hypothetical protein J5N97_025682 [Dioscorea zingiberensis]
MLEPSIWFALQQWFTPTVLFVVLNLVIGTIAITSKALRSPHADDPAGEPFKLARAPSLVLDRIRSFNLHLHRSPAPFPTLETIPPSPSLQPSDPVADLSSESPESEHHFDRSQSDTHPTAGEVPEKLATKMKKSASLESTFAHFEEKEIAPPQPAADDDAADEPVGEVDARADDFINRFRQQLKLQRIDSLLRYKEMLHRGS